MVKLLFFFLCISSFTLIAQDAKNCINVSCAKEIDVNAKFCSYCGSEQNKICSSCGSEITIIEAKFCSTCGARLNDNELMNHHNILIDERNGQEYKIINIGTQVWMAENLNYRSEKDSWCANKLVSPLESVCDSYGRLYTWEAALRICPAGWRLPSKQDFELMIGYLGLDGESIHRELLDGSIGFNYQLSGYRRNATGGFHYIDLLGPLWSSTSIRRTRAYEFSSIPRTTKMRSGLKVDGYAVRCIKD